MMNFRKLFLSIALSAAMITGTAATTVFADPAELEDLDTKKMEETTIEDLQDAFNEFDEKYAEIEDFAYKFKSMVMDSKGKNILRDTVADGVVVVDGEEERDFQADITLKGKVEGRKSQAHVVIDHKDQYVASKKGGKYTKGPNNVANQYYFVYALTQEYIAVGELYESDDAYYFIMKDEELSEDLMNLVLQGELEDAEDVTSIFVVKFDKKDAFLTEAYGNVMSGDKKIGEFSYEFSDFNNGQEIEIPEV